MFCRYGVFSLCYGVGEGHCSFCIYSSFVFYVLLFDDFFAIKSSYINM